ncbi:MAG: hypothetical protein GYB64_12880, partial [Chloroflexi bacterium]|nr:hypothetical protein [Chloroflexota bacterium]
AVAVVVLAALPAGIAQATGGKNDYVLALWLAVLTLAILRDEGPVRVGAALGLAALTKPTAYIFALPLMAWAAWRQLRDNPRRLPGYVAICAALLLTLNAGYVARNLANRGSPLGGGSAVATNERLGPGVLASNVARNLAQQAALPDPVGSWVAQAVIRGHDLFGLDATDPAATIAMDRFRLCTDLTDEFCAPNTVHLLLGAAAFALIWAHPVLREARDAQISAAGLVAGFVLFAAALKVDPIRARMHLPLFVLAAPLIGLAAERLLPRRAAFALAWVLLVLSLPWLLVNQDRPLIAVDALTDSPSILRADPVAMHFANNPALQADLTAAADAVEQAGCESVGLGLAHNDWEYPVWLLLGERDYRPAWDAAPLENGRVCAILFAQEGLTALRDEPPGFALRRWGSAAVLLPE